MSKIIGWESVRTDNCGETAHCGETAQFSKDDACHTSDAHSQEGIDVAERRVDEYRSLAENNASDNVDDEALVAGINYCPQIAVEVDSSYEVEPVVSTSNRILEIRNVIDGMQLVFSHDSFDKYYDITNDALKLIIALIDSYEHLTSSECYTLLLSLSRLSNACAERNDVPSLYRNDILSSPNLDSLIDFLSEKLACARGSNR